MQENKPDSMQTYKRLLSYVMQYWVVFLFAVVGMIVAALTETAFAALMEPMLNGSFVDKDPDVIAWVPLALIGIFVVRAAASFVSGYGMSWIGRNLILTVRNEMFSKMLVLPDTYFDQTETGKVISKFVYDAEQVANAATKSITILIRDTVTLIALFGWMLYLNVILTLTFIVVSPVIGVLIAIVSKRFRLISRRIQNSMGDVSSIVDQSVRAQRVVKIFGGQSFETDAFSNINNQNRRQQLKLAITTALSVPIIQLIIAIALAGVIYIATMKGVIEDIDVGTFMSFFIAMMMLFAPMKRLTNVNVDIQKGIAASVSIFELLDQPTEKDSGQKQLSDVVGDIQYKNVSFQYESSHRQILSNINLHIEPGKSVAFVGRSGSGKTTLVNLLPRLYEVSQGQIEVDGNNCRDLSLQSLRKHIAYVGQETIIFSATLKENIAYGMMQQACDEDIIKAAEAAHAIEFINELPDGLNTWVGEGGIQLSGGQRQRIAIARALLRNAPILILDEATSALDTESERHIQEALEELVKNRTTLVIAHRLSTIENADKIVVMDNGQIVEQGTHQELIRLENGHYAALHQIQFKDTSAADSQQTPQEHRLVD
ncbi:MAG: lipid A export permease/ATP-binding protein MsbA [Gammaproteobacteria bacterium]|nr:lipid A export permease/ATP-binding protein MsbA [Gammaproteobacteria bacterium]